MAHTAWVTMTRVAVADVCRLLSEARVDAGVKELNEMTIGRTDDPENPISVPAFEAAKLFGAGSRIPSGPADMVPRQQMPWGLAAGNLKSSPVASPKDPSNDTNAHCASPSGCT
jgi:hypothetical protein